MEDYSDFMKCMESIADKLELLQSDKKMKARYQSVKNDAFKVSCFNVHVKLEIRIYYCRRLFDNNNNYYNNQCYK